MFSRCTTRSEIDHILRAQAREHHPDVVEGRRAKQFESEEEVTADGAASPPRRVTPEEKARLDQVFAKANEFHHRMTATPFKALQDAYEEAIR